VAARWRGELGCGVGEAQRSGGTASGGPGAAIYRERKGRKGRTAGRHGSVEVAVLPAALSTRGRKKKPRKRARAKGQA
jgi:hypothetical protein